MKVLIIMLLLFLSSSTLFTNQTYIPDDRFEQFLIDIGFDEGPLNDSVPTSNIDTITKLNVVNLGISDLTGLEDFRDLEELYCNDNEISELDLSSNFSLNKLLCMSNKLEYLNLENNILLQWLYCADNNISELDLNKNIHLERILCSRNAITELDLRSNTRLETINCSINKLMNIDVTSCSELEWLHCDSNNLSVLDVRSNSILEELYCSSNSLSGLDLTNNPNLKNIFCNSNVITNLDFRLNTKLSSVHCQYNFLVELFVNNGNNRNMSFFANHNPYLTCIQVDDASWSEKELYWVRDEYAVFSEDCSSTNVEEKNYLAPKINIHPNPTSGKITVSFESVTPHLTTLKITDMLGREFQIISIGKNQFVNEVIDVNSLSLGIYLV